MKVYEGPKAQEMRVGVFGRLCGMGWVEMG